MVEDSCGDDRWRNCECIVVVGYMQKVLAATPGTPGLFTTAEIASLYQPGSPQEQLVVNTLGSACFSKIHDLLASGQVATGALATLTAVVAAAGA